MPTINKNRKKIKIIIFLLIILCSFSVYIVGCLGTTTYYYGDDIDKYLKFDEELYAYGKAPGLKGLFPIKLDSIKEIKNYYYRCKLSQEWQGSSWEVVLHAKYDEINFYIEVERLNNYLIERTEELAKFGEYKSATEEVNDRKLFNYEAFIERYYVDCDITAYHRYAYALVDGINNEIIYVYICRYPFNPIKPLLQNEYLPINFNKNEKWRTADNLKFDCYHYISNE